VQSKWFNDWPYTSESIQSTYARESSRYSHLGSRNLLHRHHKDPKPASAIVVTAIGIKL
jgi:hypothetical protein